MMIIMLSKPKTLLLIKDNHTNSWHSAYFSEKNCDGYVCSYGIGSARDTQPWQLISQ